MGSFSKLGERIDELGLFLESRAPIQKGTFLGFYTGSWMLVSGPYRGGCRHVFEVDDLRVVPRLSNMDHPICRVNEPPPGTTANCAFVRFTNAAELFPDGKRRDVLTSVRAAERHAMTLPLRN